MAGEKKKRGKWKRWLLILLILLLALLGGYCYYMSRFSFLPDWYRQRQETVNMQMLDSLAREIFPEPSPAVQPRSFTHPNVKKLLTDVAEKKDRGEGVHFTPDMISAMIRTLAYRTVPPIQGDYISSIRTTITPDNVTVEAIVNIENIPWENIPDRFHVIRAMLPKILEPDQTEIYLKGSGVPHIVDSILVAGEDATLTVGRVVYRISELMSIDAVRRRVDGRIDVRELPYKRIDLYENELVLRTE